MSYRAFWQRRCRAAAAGAVLMPQGGNCAVLPIFSFSLLSPNYAFFHKFPLKLLANGVICNTWYSSSSKPPPVYPGILLAPPAAKSCLQDTTRSAKSQPDSLHRPVFCKILLQGFAPPTIMYLWQYRIILSADTASEVRQMPSQKAQIILDVLSSILATQMPCRSCRSGALPQGGIVRCCLIL